MTSVLNPPHARAGIAGVTERSTVLAKTALAGAARSEAAELAAKAAIGTAAEEAAVIVTERGALLLIGRTVLFLTGWEVAVFITVIQLLIWYFSDNDLQTWFEKCAFGKSPNRPP